MTSHLKWVSESWLRKKEADLVHVAKTKNDGSPNPNYERAKREIEAANYHLDTKNRIIELAKSQGFVRNKYEGTCESTGEHVNAFAGFVKKSGGKWKTFSRDHVIDELGVRLVGLPEFTE